MVTKNHLAGQLQDDFFVCLSEFYWILTYRCKMFLVQTLAGGTVALHGLVITETSHGMTPVFVLDALQFGVFLAAKFAFLTPETDVRQKSFCMFEHNFNDVLINGDADQSA